MAKNKDKLDSHKVSRQQRAKKRSVARPGNRFGVWPAFPEDFTIGKPHLGILAACSVLFLLAGLFAFAPTTEALFTESIIQKPAYGDDLNDGGAMLKRSAEIKGNPVMTEFGVALQPGGRFELKWKYKKEPKEAPFARVWMYGGNVADNRVTFRAGGSEQVFNIAGNKQSFMIRPDRLADATEYEVVVSSFLDPAKTQRPQLILDKIDIGIWNPPKGEIQPRFWLVFPTIFLPWLLFWIASFIPPTRSQAVLITAIASTLLALAGLASADLFMLYAGLFLVGSLAPFFWIWKEGAAGPKLLIKVGMLIVCTALVSIALFQRWQWLVQVMDSQLFPDAQTYETSAHDMKHLYDSGAREPFHVWMIWLFSHLTAWGPTSARILTILMSTIEAVVLFVLCGEFIALPATAIVMLLYAFNPVLVASAPMGLREEQIPTAIMTFLLGCIWARRNPGSWKLQVLVVAAGIAAILTRLNALVVVVPIYAAFAWFGKWKPRFYLSAAAALVLLVAPHLIYSKLKFGDAMNSNNIYGVWWRNYEFAGKPGFITREEFAANGSAGAPCTVGHFLFGMHRPIDLTTGTLTGAFNLTAGYLASDWLLRLDPLVRTDYVNAGSPPRGSPSILERLIFLCYLIGLAGCFRLKNGWAIAGVFFLMQLPIAFLSGWFPFLGIRLMMNQTPLMLLLAGIGVWTIAALGRKAKNYMGQAEGRRA